MLSIGLLRGGSDIGAYYARDDYYGTDASPIASDAEMERVLAPVGEGGSAGNESLSSVESPGPLSPGSRSTPSSPRDSSDPALGGADRGRGQWFGKAADALGLRGSIDPKVLNAMIRGELPNGEVLGTRPDSAGDREHVGGWDLTFSAPKSVSVLAEVTGSRDLFRAHNDAVKEAVSWIEGEAACVRRAGWLGAKTEATSKLVVALFQHDTSREQDPQLHTHALVLNATQRQDGEWRSLYSRPLYEHKMAGGNVYRAALARNLQALGFETVRTHADGRFELTVVPDSVLEQFSKRREQIEDRLAAWGHEGAQASDKAALMTRARKARIDLPLLREQWMQTARIFGFEPYAALDGAQPQSPRALGEGDQDRLLWRAVDRLSEREATFSHADLVGGLLAEGMGWLDVRQAEHVIDRNTQGKGRDLYAARLGERKAWTTPTALQQERRYEDVVALTKGSVAPAVPVRSVREKLRDTFLNESQKAAVEIVTSSPDRFVAVVGRPGTGKTTMIAAAQSLLRERGFVPVGMAPNGAAAKELERVGGLVGARTIASQLARVGRRVSALKQMTVPERTSALEDLRREVWIVDEASQINNRDMRRLTHFANLTGARVAFVGDPGQLGAINAGKPFERLLATKIRQVEMDHIFRQRLPLFRDLVRSAIDRNIDVAMDLLKPSVETIDDEGQRHATMVAHWARAGANESTLMVAMRNSAKTRLNDLARDHLRNSARLGREQSAAQLLPVFSSKADRELAATYQEGDVIRFSRGNRGLSIERGTYWRVTQVDVTDAVNRLTLSDGARTISLDPRKERIAMRGAEPFRPRNTTLAVHDRIVWNRPDPDKGLVNGALLSVESVTDGLIKARAEEGFSVTIDTGSRADQHWEHAYATSLYKSQGKTADVVLVDAPLRDAPLLDQHAFLVGVSRHREQLRFFTDSPNELGQRIKFNDGDKTSAVEGEVGHRIQGLRNHLNSIGQPVLPPKPLEKEPEAQPSLGDRNRGRDF